jgi:hypothetical protein
MKLLYTLLFFCIFFQSGLSFTYLRKDNYINYKYSLKKYPIKLISAGILDNHYIVDIPYCRSNFCKVYTIQNDIIRIKSYRNFILDQRYNLPNANFNSSFLRNNLNGLIVFIPINIPKNIINNSRMQKIPNKKAHIKQENIVNNKQIGKKELDIMYISPGIDISDVSEVHMNYPKNEDAVSGYINTRNKWISY